MAAEFRVAKEWGYKPKEWFAEDRGWRAMMLSAAEEDGRMEYWITEWSRE